MSDQGQSDSRLVCTVCGRESTTSFASSLRTGWEKCCGYTMRLVQTEADIDAAVAAAVPPLARTGQLTFRGRNTSS